MDTYSPELENQMKKNESITIDCQNLQVAK